MKKVLRALLGTALSLCLVSAVALAAPASGNDRYTVGDFAVEMARMMNLPADSVDTAIASLQGRSISVTGNPARQLTEGDVVGLLSQVGISVTASDPSSPVRPQRGHDILSAFSSELSKKGGLDNTVIGGDQTNPTNPNDDFNNGNGRGGKFKRKKKNSQTGSD